MLFEVQTVAVLAGLVNRVDDVCGFYNAGAATIKVEKVEKSALNQVLQRLSSGGWSPSKLSSIPSCRAPRSPHDVIPLDFAILHSEGSEGPLVDESAVDPSSALAMRELEQFKSPRSF